VTAKGGVVIGRIGDGGGTGAPGVGPGGVLIGGVGDGGGTGAPGVGPVETGPSANSGAGRVRLGTAITACGPRKSARKSIKVPRHPQDPTSPPHCAQVTSPVLGSSQL
jgi:hypothetical protein